MIIGFLSILAETPRLHSLKNTGDALRTTSRVLRKMNAVANKKKARIAIIECQGRMSRELSSLRQLLNASKECRDVLDRFRSVLDEGTGPVARTCSVCFKILFSGTIFRCERCCEVYCSPVCQKKAWQEGHKNCCIEDQGKEYKPNTEMLGDHANYMLIVWIEQGEEELVKVVEKVLVFPCAGATLLSGCARILNGIPDSILWVQVSAMIIALYENKLVTKPDIDAGMEALASIICVEDSHNRFGEFFCQLAIKDLYTVEQLCKAAAARILNTLPKIVNLIRVCCEKWTIWLGVNSQESAFGNLPTVFFSKSFLGPPPSTSSFMSVSACPKPSSLNYMTLA